MTDEKGERQRILGKKQGEKKKETKKGQFWLGLSYQKEKTSSIIDQKLG